MLPLEVAAGSSNRSSMATRDRVRLATQRCEGQLRMVAEKDARPRAKELGDNSHASRWRPPRIERKYLGADGLYPRLGYRWAPPRGRVGQVAAVSRHDDRPNDTANL